MIGIGTPTSHSKIERIQDLRRTRSSGKMNRQSKGSAEAQPIAPTSSGVSGPARRPSIAALAMTAAA